MKSNVVPQSVNALEAASALGVSHKTVIRWVRVGGSEIISGAKRVGKEWAIPSSEIERIKARRQLTYTRVRETADWVYSIERLALNIGTDAMAGLYAAAEDFLSSSDPRALLEAVEEYQASLAMKGLVDAARDLARKARQAAPPEITGSGNASLPLAAAGTEVSDV